MYNIYYIYINTWCDPIFELKFENSFQVLSSNKGSHPSKVARVKKKGEINTCQ